MWANPTVMPLLLHESWEFHSGKWQLVKEIVKNHHSDKNYGLSHG